MFMSRIPSGWIHRRRHDSWSTQDDAIDAAVLAVARHTRLRCKIVRAPQDGLTRVRIRHVHGQDGVGEDDVFRWLVARLQLDIEERAPLRLSLQIHAELGRFQRVPIDDPLDPLRAVQADLDIDQLPRLCQRDLAAVTA